MIRLLSHTTWRQNKKVKLNYRLLISCVFRSYKVTVFYLYSVCQAFLIWTFSNYTLKLPLTSDTTIELLLLRTFLVLICKCTVYLLAMRGWSIALSVGPLFWKRLKYVHDYWMDCQKIRHLIQTLVDNKYKLTQFQVNFLITQNHSYLAD